MNLSYKHWFKKCNKFVIVITIALFLCISHNLYNQPMIEGLSKRKMEKAIKKLKKKSKEIETNSGAITQNIMKNKQMGQEIQLVKDLIQENVSAIAKTQG